VRFVDLLPVKWMTLCCHTMEPMGQNQAWRCVYKKFARWRFGRQTTTEFCQVHQNAAPSYESTSCRQWNICML